MSAGPLIIELLFVFALTVFLLHKYGDWRRQHFVVSFATLTAWYFAFIIVFILPIDVVLAFYRTCVAAHTPAGNSSQSFDTGNNNTLLFTTESPATIADECRRPGSYIPNYVLPRLWRVVYWSSQALTWLVLPLMQSYAHSGAFTALGKLKSALIDNAIYYGSYLLIFGILLVYVAAKGLFVNAGSLKVVCVTASNTWGMFWLILLLGYGLVEVPRQMWLAGLKGHRLQKTYFDVEKLSTEKNDAEETLKEVYRESRAAYEAYRDGHPLKKCADVILQKFPAALVTQLTRYSSNADVGSSISLSEKELTRLHKRVIVALGNYNRCQAQWTALIDRALHLEDVAKNEQQPTRNGEFVRTYKKIRSPVIEVLCSPKIEWIWECLLKKYVIRLIAVLLAILSIFIVWSEVTFFSVHPRLSLAAVFVHLASKGESYGYIELSSVITVMYMCICAYFTVFRIKIYRYYHLDPHHHTDENSLLFSAILLCRLTPPLCLNFLGMIHMDSHLTNEANIIPTAYTSIMGHLSVIPFIEKGFNIYFPMAILLLCIATYFRLGTRCLHYIGFEQFIHDSDEMTVEMVQGGKSLVIMERNRLTRQTEREARDEFWREKLGSSNRSFTRRDPEAAATSFRETTSTAGPFDSRVGEETGVVNDPSGWLKTSKSNSSNRLDYGSSPFDDQRPPQKSPSKNFFDDL